MRCGDGFWFEAILDTENSSVGSSIGADPFVVLVVEQSGSLRRIYEGYLDALISSPKQIHIACSGQEALKTAGVHRPNLIILDLGLDDIEGPEVVQTLRLYFPSATILGVAVQTSLNMAVEAMRAGATDVLIKPLNREKFKFAIRNSAVAEASAPNETATADYSNICNSSGFIGSSAAMQIVYKTISVAAPSNATVFITGESGTGKELYAEAIHNNSKRAGKAMISLNCSAIPRDLIESEIFGHVRGSFTGATEDRDGAAILADGGTLFLDEICEMNLDLQAKLLRFIQTSKVQRVGETLARKVDVRFVCATNRDLVREVAAGRMREDLYYRLHVIPVHLPPLRAREGDIHQLADVFLQRFANKESKTFCGFSAEAIKLLETYDWPGNVRQLENTIQNIVVMNAGGVINETMLPSVVTDHKTTAEPATFGTLSDSGSSVVVDMPGVSRDTRSFSQPRPYGKGQTSSIRPLRVEEKEIIERAIAACDGNTVLAAALLEVSPSTLYRKIKSWSEAEQQASASLKDAGNLFHQVALIN